MSKEKDNLLKKIEGLKKQNKQDASIIENFSSLQEQFVNKNKSDEDKIKIDR